MASGTLTGSVQSLGRGPYRPICKITLSWTSMAGGAVNQVVVDGNGNAVYVSGELLRVVFIPGTGGNQPSNNYGARSPTRMALISWPARERPCRTRQRRTFAPA